jgi:hypothetical protein
MSHRAETVSNCTIAVGDCMHGDARPRRNSRGLRPCSRVTACTETTDCTGPVHCLNRFRHRTAPKQSSTPAMQCAYVSPRISTATAQSPTAVMQSLLFSGEAGRLFRWSRRTPRAQSRTVSVQWASPRIQSTSACMQSTTSCVQVIDCMAGVGRLFRGSRILRCPPIRHRRNSRRLFTSLACQLHGASRISMPGTEKVRRASRASPSCESSR